MKNKLILFMAVLALVVTALVVWWRLEPDRLPSEPIAETAEVSSKRGSNADINSNKDAQVARDSPATKAEPDLAPTVPEEPLYQMSSVTSSFNPAVEAEKKKALPFQMFASGGSGKVVDRGGNIVLKSDSENAIFKIEVSPNQTSIAVHRGSGKYDIVTPSTGETIRLPQQPPGENMLGFGSWHWIDDQTLVGVSGKTIPFRDDQVGPEREEPIISRSVLYLYDLKERRLSEVELPPALRTKSVSVSAVDETGKVQLRPEGHDVSYTDASLGWFEVRPKK